MIRHRRRTVLVRETGERSNRGRRRGRERRTLQGHTCTIDSAEEPTGGRGPPPSRARKTARYRIMGGSAASRTVLRGLISAIYCLRCDPEANDVGPTLAAVLVAGLAGNPHFGDIRRNGAPPSASARKLRRDKSGGPTMKSCFRSAECGLLSPALTCPPWQSHLREAGRNAATGDRHRFVPGSRLSIARHGAGGRRRSPRSLSRIISGGDRRLLRAKTRRPSDEDWACGRILTVGLPYRSLRG